MRCSAGLRAQMAWRGGACGRVICGGGRGVRGLLVSLPHDGDAHTSGTSCVSFCLSMGLLLYVALLCYDLRWCAVGTV